QVEPEKIEVKKLSQKYTLIDSEERVRELVKQLKTAKELVVDTETTSISVLDAKLLGVALAFKEGEAYYVPENIVSDDLKRILADEKIKKIGHNLKYDSLVLEQEEKPLHPLSFDTMIASYLLNPGVRQHGLDSLAFNEL